MLVDIIIISCSKNEELKRITQTAIDTLHRSETDYIFNIILVETSFFDINYSNCTVKRFVQMNFNYHKAINFGLQFCENEYIGIFNNDVEFEPLWFTKLVAGFENFGSLSPVCRNSHKFLDTYKEKFNFGYATRIHISGWAIVINKATKEKIKCFDESVEFWQSEKVYARQLQYNDIKHAICKESFVNHLESRTLNTVGKVRKKYLTTEQLRYVQKKTYNKFAIIMASSLEDYPNAASARENKIIRAINSVIKQTFGDWQLIIVADGCQKTADIYQKLYSENKQITCLSIRKQEYMSGNVRQYGIEYAFSDYIIYLDNDDEYGANHLQKINANLGVSDWVYYNDWYITNDGSVHKKDVILQISSIGTSSICHKRLLNVSWHGCNGYTHDWSFVKKLIDCSTNYRKLGIDSEYYIRHTASGGIDN
jgi:glycosyltransferase involved in cell wall biosynthesis